jgi:uncharacterized protein DUF4412
MRRAVLACTVTLGLAVSASTAAAQAFQGKLSFTVHEDNGKTTEITQYTRTGKSALIAHEAGKAGGGMIVDSAAGTMTMLDGEKKTYTVINLAAMRQMMQGFAGMAKGMMGHRGDSSESHGPKGTVTPTGRTEVVAGVTCSVYAYDGTEDGHHRTGEVCLAKGVGLMAGGSFPGMDMGMMGMQQRQSMQQRLTQWGPLGSMLSQGYGVLKATSTEDGKPKGSMEVTEIQRGAPPDAMFAPPAGYTEKQMPMMGRP